MSPPYFLVPQEDQFGREESFKDEAAAHQAVQVPVRGSRVGQSGTFDKFCKKVGIGHFESP